MRRRATWGVLVQVVIHVQAIPASTELTAVAIAHHVAARSCDGAAVCDGIATVCAQSGQYDANRLGDEGGQCAQHSPAYSTPARTKPAVLHAKVHPVTVILAAGMEAIAVVSVRPVVPSLWEAQEG